MSKKPLAVLIRRQMEVGGPVKGYRWVEGRQVLQPNGKLLFPYVRIREARAFCRDQRWRYVEANSEKEAREAQANEIQRGLGK